MRKNFYFKLLLLLLIVFLQFACKNNAKNNATNSTDSITQQDTEQNSDSGDEEYSFEYQGRKYMYLIKDNKAEITDSITGKVIIPDDFDFIVYPGETYAGMVEVCKDGKYGLYSFPEGKEILPAEYDAFYPAYDNRILAYYKKDNKYGYIKKKTATSDAGLEIYKKSPFQNETIEKWKFSIPTEVYMNYDEWTAILYTPSFMNYFLSETEWEGSEFDSEIIYTSFDLSVKGKLKDNKKKYYIVEITTDEDYAAPPMVDLYACNDDTVIHFYNSSLNLLWRYSCGDGFSMKIINDTLLRIKDYYEPGYSDTSKYFDTYFETNIPLYFYYKVSNGKLQQIKTHRFFPFTKYEKITPEFFTGCFIRPIENNEGVPLLSTRSHLIINELDIMRNEIFADHGYKFKTKKWQEFFSKVPWYKPRYDNVNDKLSDIENYNIKIILQEKAKIQENPEKYTKTDTVMYNFAG